MTVDFLYRRKHKGANLAPKLARDYLPSEVWSSHYPLGGLGTYLLITIVYWREGSHPSLCACPNVPVLGVARRCSVGEACTSLSLIPTTTRRRGLLHAL